jgi:hypothetical protein
MRIRTAHDPVLDEVSNFRDDLELRPLSVRIAVPERNSTLVGDSLQSLKPRIGIVQELALVLTLATALWPSREAATLAAFGALVILVASARLVHHVKFSSVVLIGLLALSGSLGLAFSNPTTDDLVRDLGTLARLAALLLVGLVAALDRSSLPRIVRAFVLAGAIEAAQHLANVVASPAALTESLNTLREDLGKGSLTEAIALCLLLLWSRAGFADREVLAPAWRKALTITLSASVLISFSRTILLAVIVVLLVSVLIDRHEASQGRRARKKRGRLLAIVVVLAAVSGLVAFAFPIGPLQGFATKVANSIEEVMPRNATTRTEITLAYRSYESFKALEAYNKGTIVQQIFGRGWGYSVDLGTDTASQSSGLVRTTAPVLHNGYLQLLVKSGIVGVGLYLLLLWMAGASALRAARATGPSRLLGEVAFGIILVTVPATGVIIGLLSSAGFNSVTVLIGVALALGSVSFGRPLALEIRDNQPVSRLGNTKHASYR